MVAEQQRIEQMLESGLTEKEVMNLLFDEQIEGTE